MTDVLSAAPVSTPRLTKLRRLAATAAPAAGITLGLFMIMQNLIVVDANEAPAFHTYKLEPYIVPLETPILPVKRRAPIRREIIAPPPLPEPMLKSVGATHLTVAAYTGAAPAEYGQVDLESLKPTRISTLPFRSARAISPPIPVYPAAAITRGLSGSCEVSLNITPKGAPFDVRASCSDRIFERAAEKAVKKVKFVPKIHNGRPVTVTGVVYPLEFRMEP